MSKIEEALRKAKSERSKGDFQSESNNKNSHNVENISFSRTLQTTANSISQVVPRESSVKEIALMSEDEILENKQLSELKIIYSDMPDLKYANVYRDLRTKLLQKTQGRNFIVMITSCMPGEGSGNVALNLATAFTFDESKTSLLIDCDLNNPKIDAILDLQSDVGLTDYLERDDVEVGSIVHKTGIKRLRMVPAGSSRETATEYFTSVRMRELLEELYLRYTDRYVFLHAAPIVESADTRILVELCDYVILVVPYGQATKIRVKAAADAIGSEKLLGAVFNEIPGIPRTSKKTKRN
ncbi:MAG: polysaccharide biosynthesis protein [Gammaproteobacteria bacterium]|nr:polysaccharide biosynthesis protein [Gammaproteobacteria bacterium]